MPEMTAPNGTTRNVPAAGVEALRALGWTGAEPEAEPEQPDPEPEQPSTKSRARGSRASSKASKED